MAQNDYNREILSLIMDDGVSFVLQEYIISLVRAGYFDEDKVLDLVGKDVRISFKQKKVINRALKTAFLELRDQTGVGKLQELLKLDIIAYDPKGHPIKCIKEIRNATHWGLRETKEFFDHIKPELIEIQMDHDV